MVGEILVNKFKIVTKKVGYIRVIAVAVGVLTKIRKEHKAKKDGEWEEGKNAGVGVFRKKTVPLFEEILEAMCGEN